MASSTEESKRKILIAVDLSNWAEEAFDCEHASVLVPFYCDPDGPSDLLDLIKHATWRLVEV